MNATECPTKAAGSERRTPDGKFLNHPGPGRPSKRILDLCARYKGKTTNEELQRLAGDVERLEMELTQADQEIDDAERRFIESISPAVHHREEIALTLSRARVVRYYLADPASFGGYSELPADAALREYTEIRRQLDVAQRELADTPEPSYGRVEALADSDKWTALSNFEQARDRVDELLGEENRARLAAEGFGHNIPPRPEGPTLDGDPFTRPRNTRREMVNSV